MTTPSPEPLKLVEECLEVMGWARSGVTGNIGRGWRIRGTSANHWVSNLNPLSNDFAAICKQWLLDQGFVIQLTLFPKETEEALGNANPELQIWKPYAKWFNDELGIEFEAPSENEAIALAVLACAKAKKEES